MLLSNQFIRLLKKSVWVFMPHCKGKQKVFLKKVFLSYVSEITNNILCVFGYSTGSQRHDDGNRRGQQWDSHSGGMAEGRHEQHPFACVAWTEGDVRNTSLQVKGSVCKVLLMYVVI